MLTSTTVAVSPTSRPARRGGVRVYNSERKEKAMTDTLYQFFQNSRYGNSDTLQIYLSREEALDLIAALAKQLKDDRVDDGANIEMVGAMVVAELNEVEP